MTVPTAVLVALSLHPPGGLPAGAAAAIGALAGALLTAGRPPGRARLRELFASPAAAPVPVATLRPGWVVVGAAAIGAVAWMVTGPVGGALAGGAAAVAGMLMARRSTGHRGDGGATGELAGRWELLAVLLESGLPVAAAVAAAAEPLGGDAGARLRRVAGLLELGADPVDAWRAAADMSVLAPFARAAGSSAGTGAALAQVARQECVRIRAELVDTAHARAQRAAVLITGPLGLCFLPAFLVLGIAPVVVGLAGKALAQW